jgi:hypothetical protein
MKLIAALGVEIDYSFGCFQGKSPEKSRQEFE